MDELGVLVLPFRPHQACCVSAAKLSLEETQAEEIHTDESGRFAVPNRPEPHSILGLFEEGFLHQPLEDASVYSLKPWASLEGTWLENGHAMEGIKLGFGVWQSTAGSVLTHFTDTATTNDQGKFIFNRVPVANARLCQILHSGPVTDYRWLKTVDVLPHTGTQITLNHPRLRALHGRVEIPEHLKAKITPRPWHAMLEYDRPPLPAPQSVIQDPLKYRKWYQEWIQTEEGANYVAGRDESACLYVDDNGNFKTESIFPGKYRITFSYREKATDSDHRYSMPIIANVTRKIEITQSSP